MEWMTSVGEISHSRPTRCPSRSYKLVYKLSIHAYFPSNFNSTWLVVGGPYLLDTHIILCIYLLFMYLYICTGGPYVVLVCNWDSDQLVSNRP